MAIQSWNLPLELLLPPTSERTLNASYAHHHNQRKHIQQQSNIFTGTIRTTLNASKFLISLCNNTNHVSYLTLCTRASYSHPRSVPPFGSLEKLTATARTTHRFWCHAPLLLFCTYLYSSTVESRSSPTRTIRKESFRLARS